MADPVPLPRNVGPRMTAPAVFATSAYCKRCGWGHTHRTHNPLEADSAQTWMEQELDTHTRTHRAAT